MRAKTGPLAPHLEQLDDAVRGVARERRRDVLEL
jgi:hypothetical protein